MKLYVKRTIFFVLTIIIFITIFIFSNENGEKSTATSKGFTEKVVNMIPIVKKMEKSKKEQLIGNLQFGIRKTAHFTIYAMAGINIMGFLCTYEQINKKEKVKITGIVGMLYAISDEIHQMYSAGRSASIIDVGIDTLGILFGAIIMLKLIKVK